ncbi:MAG: ABC transporter ATP-binding protein [Acidiferrobacterales bacterium]
MRLQVDRLDVRVPGKHLCVGLTLQLGLGENWAVLGANGSGKTTLLHTLAGLRSADDGRVLLEERDIGDYPHRMRARHLGVLFQDYDTAFPATVLETVLTGRHPYLSRWQWQDDADDLGIAETALSVVGLAGFEHRRLSTLSGGERRRVEIAAVLAQDPPVLLLDEPTNHLDLRHQIEILQLLTRRRQQRDTLNVLVMHDINLALRFCTHALLLFGDGECRHGELPGILDVATLRDLYGYPIRKYDSADGVFYGPA